MSLVCSPHFSSYNTELYTAICREYHENPSCSLISMTFCFTIDSHNKIEICTRTGIRRKIGSELNANWFIISSSCSYWIALLFMTKEIKNEERKKKKTTKVKEYRDPIWITNGWQITEPLQGKYKKTPPHRIQWIERQAGMNRFQSQSEWWR